MKDVTLSPVQFNIQLERSVLSVLDRSKFRQNASPGYPQTPLDQFSKIQWPRKFREVRALLIASWYLPDWLKWEVVLHYSVEFSYSLDLKSKGFEHSLEYKLLSTSKEIMINYLLKVSTLTARDLFGNVLRRDLESALNSLRIIRVPRKVRRKIRRRGYQDKGTWKTPDRWTEKFDFSLREQQLEREKLKLYLELFYFTYLSKLR